MRFPTGNLDFLNNALTSLGEAFEFLTMSMIIMQRGWSTSIPEPDRGADVLAFNNVRRYSIPVQVKAARVLTADYPQVRNATRQRRHAYQIDISRRQLEELDRDPQPFIVWLIREEVEPLALVLRGEILTSIRQIRPGAQDQLNVFFYQSYDDQNDILYHSHVNDEYQLREYVEAWDDCFPRNDIPDADRKMMLGAATENLTIHYLLLQEGGWTAAKPHPDRGADILALQNDNDVSIPCQVKASMIELTSGRENTARTNSVVPFHFTVSTPQASDLQRRKEGTIFVLWLCFSEVSPYRWEPLIFRGDELWENKPGVWNLQTDNFWAYVSLENSNPVDHVLHENKPIESIVFGGPTRDPTDVTSAYRNWEIFGQ